MSTPRVAQPAPSDHNCIIFTVIFWGRKIEVPLSTIANIFPIRPNGVRIKWEGADLLKILHNIISRCLIDIFYCLNEYVGSTQLLTSFIKINDIIKDILTRSCNPGHGQHRDWHNLVCTLASYQLKQALHCQPRDNVGLIIKRPFAPGKKKELQIVRSHGYCR